MWTSSNQLKAWVEQKRLTLPQHACCHFRCVQLFATLWTVALQTYLSMGSSRQEYWSGLPCPLPGDLPNPETEPRSPAQQADSSQSEPPGKPKNTGVVAYPFSRGSSWPKNWTGVSCIAGRFFTSWATREHASAQNKPTNESSVSRIVLLLAWGHRVQVMI